MRKFFFDKTNITLLMIAIITLLSTIFFTAFSGICEVVFSCLVSICASVFTATSIPAWMRYLDNEKNKSIKNSIVSEICETQDIIIGNILSCLYAQVDINSLNPSNNVFNMASINLTLGDKRGLEISLDEVTRFLKENNKKQYDEIMSFVYIQRKSKLVKFINKIDDYKRSTSFFTNSEIYKLKQIEDEILIFEKESPKDLDTIKKIIKIMKDIRKIINWDKKIKIEYTGIERL